MKRGMEEGFFRFSERIFGAETKNPRKIFKKSDGVNKKG
jgi:hypothetical protein